MTKYLLDILTMSAKQTDKQADRVLQLGQVTEKKEKAYPSHFLKFLLASPQKVRLVPIHRDLVLPNTQTDTQTQVCKRANSPSRY